MGFLDLIQNQQPTQGKTVERKGSPSLAKADTATTARVVGDDVQVVEQQTVPVPAALKALEPIRVAPVSTEIEALLDMDTGLVPLDGGQAFQPSAYRVEAAERKRFLEAVMKYWRGPFTLDEAVARVRREPATDWKLLSKGGNHGGDRRTKDNFKTWRKLCGKHANGQLDLSNWASALSPDFKSGRRKLRGDVEFWRLFAAEYQDTNRLSPAAAHRIATRRYRKTHPHRRVDAIPTLRQVRHWLKRREVEHYFLLKRMGREWYEQHHIDHVDRDMSLLGVMECVVLDHRHLDFWVRATCPKTGKDIARRPWFSAAMDMRSRKMVGKVFLESFDPDNYSVILSMEHTILNTGCRVPKEWYIDNGKDYCAQGIFEDFVARSNADSATEHPHSILRELGGQVHFAIPYNAKAKTIERWFRDMGAEFDRMWPSYCGNCPANRPESAENYRGDLSKLLTLDQVATFFEWWVREWHDKPSKANGLDGLSPNQLWDREIGKTAPWDEGHVELAMLRPVTGCTVRKGGLVQYKGDSYVCDEASHYKGERVMLKIAARDPDHVYLHTLDGKMIGAAKVKHKHHPTQDGELAGKHRARRYKRLAATRVALVDDLGTIHAGTPTASGNMAELSGLDLEPRPVVDAVRPPTPALPAAADPEAEDALEAWTDVTAEPAADDDDEFDAMSMWTGAE